MNIKKIETVANKKKIITWASSFNDTITILVIFFAFLFVVSTVDSFKYNKFTRSIKRYLDLSISNFYSNEKTTNRQKISRQNIKLDLIEKKYADHNRNENIDTFAQNTKKNMLKMDVYYHLKKVFEEYEDINILNNMNSLNVLIQRRENTKNINEHGLTPKCFKIFNIIAESIRNKNVSIEVEDYSKELNYENTDYELYLLKSVSRSIKIMNYFIVECKIRPKKISVESHPSMNLVYYKQNFNIKDVDAIIIKILFSEEIYNAE